MQIAVSGLVVGLDWRGHDRLRMQSILNLDLTRLASDLLNIWQPHRGAAFGRWDGARERAREDSDRGGGGEMALAAGGAGLQ